MTGTDPATETLCFLVIYNTRRLIQSSDPVVMSVIHHRQNRLDSTCKGHVCEDLKKELKTALRRKRTTTVKDYSLILCAKLN
jgi:hypothetical protein